MFPVRRKQFGRTMDRVQANCPVDVAHVGKAQLEARCDDQESNFPCGRHFDNISCPRCNAQQTLGDRRMVLWGRVAAHGQAHFAGTAETNLEQVWAEIKEQYRIQRTTTQFSSMKATMFSGGTVFPKLKGKASENRHIGKPPKVVLDAHMDSANQQHRMVSLALKFSIWIEDILDAYAGNITLPAEDHKRLVEATYAFLNLVVSLGNYYHPRGVLFFNYTVKFHYLLHIAIGSKHYNPRWAWCYSGEAFMQVIKKVVASCQSGKKVHLIGRKVLRKYADGLSFSLLGDEWWH